VLTAGAERASSTVPNGTSGRLLVLADAADSRWHATIGGKKLEPRTAWGWAQGFAVPAGGGKLEVTYDHGPRRAALIAQVVVLLVVLVLSAPGGRRRRGLEDDITLEDDDVKQPERFVPVAAL
jgi:hypothetical protein